MAKRKTDDNIVQGTTTSGIKFTLDKRIKDDARILYWITKMDDDKLGILERNNALFSLLELIFGTDDNLSTFLNEVAAKHNGVADVESLIGELHDMFEALKLKNS